MNGKRVTVLSLFAVLCAMFVLVSYSQTFYRMFCAATGYGRSKMWALIRAGKIRAKKDDGVTIIERAELQRYIQSLPDRETTPA